MPSHDLSSMLPARRQGVVSPFVTGSVTCGAGSVTVKYWLAKNVSGHHHPLVRAEILAGTFTRNTTQIFQGFLLSKDGKAGKVTDTVTVGLEKNS